VLPQEIHGRLIWVLLAYFRVHHPEKTSQLQESLLSMADSFDQEWYSYQTFNRLFLNAIELSGNSQLPLIIGHQTMQASNRSWIGLLLRSLRTPGRMLRVWSDHFHFWNRISDIALLEQAPGSLLLEHRLKSGFIATPVFCQIFKGILQELLNFAKVSDPEVAESACSLAVWQTDAGPGSRWVCRGEKLWMMKAGGAEEFVGTLSPDGSYLYQGILYGAGACRYRLRWSGQKSGWPRLRNWLWSWTAPGHLRDVLQRQSHMIETQRARLEQAEDSVRLMRAEHEQHVHLLEQRIAQTKAALEAATLKLKEWDGMKYYMLSITSHELRTPLTIIKGALHLIETEGEQLGPERARKYLTMAERNTGRLIQLLNDIMDFSRLEFGHLKLDLGRVDLVRLLREAAEDFRNDAEKRGVEVTCKIDGDLPFLVGDQGRIRQICNNLIANAIKFTPTGGRVEISAGQFGHFVEMVFADNGIGISRENLEKIFMKFQQIEDSLRREAEGVGLGLAIVRELVRLHDGKIWVESEKGNGSRFHVRLPLDGPLDPEVVAKRKLQEDRQPPLVLGNSPGSQEQPGRESRPA